MSIERIPMYGGVEYIDRDSGAVSTAHYPVTHTEVSAIQEGLFDIQKDETGELARMVAMYS